jgi:hypothetical protein
VTVPEFSAASIVDVPPNQWAVITQNDKALAATVASVQVSVTTLASEIGALRTEAARAFALLDSRQRDSATVALQEETQVLWWLFGGWSEDAGGPFGKIKLPGGGLLLGAEFAKMTRFVPAHPQTEAILGRAVVQCAGSNEPAPLCDVVSSTDLNWRRKLISLVGPEDVLTPVLCAITRSAESQGDHWHEAFQTVTGVSPKLSASPAEWAARLCTEILLRRALANATA